MAVITLYFQSLLVLLIGLSNVVQGRSLSFPRDPQAVTEPSQALGSIDSVGRIAPDTLSQNPIPMPQDSAPFQDFGYLKVWRAAKLNLGYRGWLSHPIWGMVR